MPAALHNTCNPFGAYVMQKSLYASGKKDTPASAVQADSYVPDFIPAGVRRVARILAGRKQTEAAASAQKPPFRSFAAQA